MSDTKQNAQMIIPDEYKKFSRSGIVNQVALGSPDIAAKLFSYISRSTRIFCYNWC